MATDHRIGELCEGVGTCGLGGVLGGFEVSRSLSDTLKPIPTDAKILVVIDAHSTIASDTDIRSSHSSGLVRVHEPAARLDGLHREQQSYLWVCADGRNSSCLRYRVSPPYRLL